MKRVYQSFILILCCLGTLQDVYAQPTNDVCGSAQSITVGVGTCSSILFTNVGATTTGNPATPACWLPNTMSNTVWFSFVATKADIELSTNFGGTLTDTQIAVYSGTCGSLTQIACQEDVNTAGALLHTDVIIHGLTIGNTYFVAVDGKNNATGTFGICAQESLPIGPTLPVQDCATAQTLCDVSNIVVPDGPGSTGTNQENPTCFGAPGERSSNWYTFTVATSGNLCFTISPNSNIDYDFAVYNTSTSCPGTELSCNWSPTSPTTGLGCPGGQCNACLNVVAGQSYSILVDRFTASSSSGFTLNFGGTTAAFASPYPTFTATTACIGNPTTFTNTTNGNFTYSWNFGDGFTSNLENPTHTYATAGTFAVTLLLTAVPGGCQNSVTQSVTVNPLPTVDAGSGGTVCPGGCVTLSGATNAVGSVGPTAFTNSSTYAVPDNIATGVFSPIPVSGVVPGTISASSIASVCINMTHTFDADLDIYLQCPDGTRIELSTDNGGANDNYTNTCFTPTAANPIASGTAPFTGNYSPEESFALLIGCTANGTWQLFAQDDLATDTGNILGWTITFNNNLPAFTWSPTTGMTNSNTLTPTVCPAVTTTYTLTANNGVGCTSTDQVTVTVQAPPSAPTLTATQPTCTVATGTVTITGIAGLTYSFDGGAYTSTLVYSGLAAGSTHTVTAQATPGCISLASTVTLNTPPAAPTAPALTPTQPTCTVATGGITITGVAGLTYSFDGGAYSSTLVYGGLATGSTHTVTAQNAAGCISTASSISLNAQPTSPAAPTLTPTQPTCTVATGVITITGSAGLTYSIDGGAYSSTLVYSGLAAGSTHNVIAQNAAGCISSTSSLTLLTQPSAPSAPAVTTIQPTCTISTGTITITVVAGLTYNFDGGAYSSTLIYSGLAGGSTHTITAQNAAGCISPVTSITLASSAITPIAPALTPTQPTCGTATGTIAITGVAGETYSFDGGAYSASLVYGGLVAGSTHSVTAQNAAGCISPITNITLNAQPATPAAPVLTPTQPTCAMTTGTITITNVAGETYSFDGGAYSATLVYGGLAAGSSHTVTSQNASGCISAATNITLNAQPATPAAPVLTPTQPTCAMATGAITITALAGLTYSFDGGAYSATLIYSGLTAGSTHNVTAQNAAGCISAAANITLNAQPATPAAPVLTPTQPTCAVATGTITITGVAGETYSFDGGAYSATLVYGGLVAGSTHSVTAQNASGCISAATNITLNAQPATPAAPVLTPTQPTCAMATGTITITNVAGETYSFDGGAYSATLVYGGLSAGSSHSVTAQNAAGCISPITNIPLNAQPATPAAPVLTPTQPTCAVATGTITITAVAGLTYSFDGGSYSATLVYGGLAAGSSHTVTAQSASGCVSAAANITLNTQPPTPAAPVLTPTQPTCAVATGTITITAVAGMTYSFDGGSYSASLVYGGLAAGSSHSVTAQNASGCISAAANITLNAQPATPAAPVLTPTHPTCAMATGTITITAVAGMTYSFDGGAYSASLVYGGLAAGSSHSVTAQSAAGCISIPSSIILNAQPATPPAPVLTATQPTCIVSTGTITITASAGLTYSFDGGAYSANLVYGGLPAGSTHSVTAQNAAGCVSSASSLTLNTQPATPTAPVLTPTQPSCITPGIVTISGVAGETYSLDGGPYSSTLIYSGISAGTPHNVTAQNAAGCISPASTVTLSLPPGAPPAPILTATQPTCTVATGTITITPVTGLTFSFDGGAYSTTLVYGGLLAGSTHTVSTQNAGGCVSASTLTLNVQPTIPGNPLLTATQPTCTISTGTINITGAAGITYSFDGGPYSAALVYSGLAPGSTHNVTAQNAFGCISSVSSITLNVQPTTPGMPIIIVTQPTCTISTGTITITATPGVVYSFDGASYAPTLVYSGLTAGSSHTVIAQNAAGCTSAVSTITLSTQPGTPSAPIISPIQPTCSMPTGSVTITAGAGLTYSFDNGAYSTTLAYSGLLAGSTHTVTAQNAMGCISSISSITLSIPPSIPTIPIVVVTQPTCTTSAGAVTITAIAGLTYSFDGGPYSSTLVFGGLAAGSTHTVTAQNLLGCISSPANITLNSQPATPASPTFILTQPTCTVSTGAASITGVSGETYSFDNQAYSATLVYSGLIAGSSHSITSRNAAGCTSSIVSFTVGTQPVTPAAPTLTPTQPTCTVSTGTITITPIVGMTYSFDGSPYSSTLVYGGLAAGSTHIVTSQNSSGCISPAASVTLTSPPGAPAVPIAVTTQPTCTVATGTISITPIAGLTYSFDGGPYSSTLVYGGLAAGSTHPITAQNAAGCISSPATITLNSIAATPAAPVVVLTQPTCTVPTGSVTIIGVPGETYSFDSAAYSPTLFYSGLLAGSTHTVTAQNAAGCISAVANITFNVQPSAPATPVITATQPTCTVSTGMITITPIVGMTYSFDGGAYSSTLVYGGLAAGSTHNVTAQNSSGCISSAASLTLITPPGAPAVPIAVTTQPTCTVVTGTISITPIAGLTYSFDGGPYSSTLVYGGLAAGSTHVITAQNAAGCLSSPASITLNSIAATPAAPVVMLTQPTCTVPTGSVTIIGVAGETYSFDNGAYSTTLFYNGLLAGSTHTVTAQNAAGCISPITSVTLNAQPPAPAAPSVATIQPTCTNSTGTITITTVVGLMYSFDGGTYSPAFVYSGLAPGSTHTITAQNAAGCISPATNITINTQSTTPGTPAVTVIQPSCTIATGSISITGVPGLTYSFDSGPYSSTLVYSGLTAGSTHTVTAKNTSGCISAVASITINSQPSTPAAPLLTATQPTCTVATGTITITAFTGMTYSFDGGPFTSTLTYAGLAAGSSHTVVIKNAGGCVSLPSSMTLNAQPITPSVPIISIVQPTCAIPTGAITITGIPGLTYSFDGGLFTNTLVYSGLASGSTHNVRAQNSEGCISPAENTTLIIQPVTPVALATPTTQSICSGTNTAIALSSTVGTVFNWTVLQTNAAGAVAGSGNNISQSLTTTSNLPGQVIYTIIPVANGCTGLPTTVTIIVNPVPIAIANPTAQTLCSGERTNISLTNAGSAPTTFNWTVTQTGATGASAGSGNNIAQTLTATGVIPGLVTYNIFAISNGCAGPSTLVTIIVNPAPVVTSPMPSSICDGDAASVLLTSNIAGTTYSWTVVQSNVMGASDGNGSNINQVLNTIGENGGTAVYTITPTSNGCVGAVKILTVVVNPLPRPVLTNGVICVDPDSGAAVQSYTLNTGLSNSAYDFEWRLDNVIISGATNNTFPAIILGTYSVIATNVLTGCVSEEAFATVSAAFIAHTMTATVTEAFTETTSIVVNVPSWTGPFLYQLDNGALQISNVFTNMTSGLHTVYVTDENGCTNLQQEVLIINYPKFFTPNGDGYNDTWNIWDLVNQPYSKIYLFDRYGKFIKEISPQGTGWDGTYNDHELPSTDYWFTVDYSEGGSNKVFKAHFSLKR